MAISKDDVKKVFQTLLGRLPESDVVYRNNTQVENIDGLIWRVVLSQEFQKRFVDHLYSGMTDKLQPFTKERVIFLHVPKCGGTTLHNTLVNWYGSSNAHPERHNGLYYYSAANLASKLVFSGHYDYYSINLVPGPAKIVSFLRDPVERLISLYNFHRAHRPEVVERDKLQLAGWAIEYAIDDYFTRPEVIAHPAINNTMARYFSNEPQVLFRWEGSANGGQSNVEELSEQALRNIKKFDFIGFLDEYDASILKLANLLGFEPPSKIQKGQVLDELMDRNPGMRRIERQRPSEGTLARMEDLVRYDRQIYEAAQQRFAA